MFGLADCNNFFVSCERTLDPTLEGRPVVVLSNNDGCVIARSNEAKRIGIKMGQPTFEIRDLIRAGQVVAISDHHSLYHDISERVHRIFSLYAPKTIDYSIDEAFLDMAGIPVAALPSIGEALVEHCRREARIPITVGFAPTKTLAKICAEICKKSGEPYGILATREQIETAMEKIPIQDLWGIGRRLAKRLWFDGVHTAGAYSRLDIHWVRANFGVNGERIWRELHEENCVDLAHTQRAMQDSISETRTFPTDTNDYGWLRSNISQYAAHCAQRLVNMRGVCSRLTVFLRTNRFAAGPLLTPNIGVCFERPTNDPRIIIRSAVEALDKIFDIGTMYKRGGVILDSIAPAQYRQPSLFDEKRAIQGANMRQARILQSGEDRDIPYHLFFYTT